MSKPKQIRPVTGSTEKIRMMLYGIPGCGKTKLIGSGKKTLIVRPPFDHTASIKEGTAEQWVVDDWSAMDEVMMYMLAEGHETYDWLWLDSISLFQKAGLDDLWATVIHEKPHRARYGLDKQEYGINMDRLGRWCRTMSGAEGFNFGITAHPFKTNNPAARNEDEDEQDILMPYVQGVNMPEQICGYMNLVAYLDVVHKDGKDIRVLRTNATDRYYAKDQFDAFADGKMVSPTMDKIMAAIKKSGGISAPARRTQSTPRRARRRTGGK